LQALGKSEERLAKSEKGFPERTDFARSGVQERPPIPGF